MGALDLIGAIASPVTAVVSGLANLGSSLVNAHSQKETNKRNAEMNASNNAFNGEQSKLQRDWSSSEASLAREHDTSERLASQEWQEKMSDPSYQIGRMLEAGVSPAAYGGDQSVSSANGSNVGAPAGSAASAATPIPMQAPQFHFDPLAMSQAALNMAQAKSITDANRREEDLHGVHVEQEGVRLCLLQDELNNLRPAEVKKLQQEADAVAKSISVMDSEISVNEANASLIDKQGQLVQKEIDSYAVKFQKYLEETDSRIKVNDANAKAAVARASESYAAVQLAQKQGEYYDAAAGLAAAQTGVAKAQENLLGSQNVGQIIQNGLNGLEFSYQSKVMEKEAEFRLSSIEGELQLIPLNNEARQMQASADYQRGLLDRNINGIKAHTGLQIIEATASALGYPFGAGVSYNNSTIGQQPSNRTVVRGFK